MKALDLRPYRAGDSLPLGSVPVTVIILTKNEAVNIERCIASVGWAAQVVVLDSGSSDSTVDHARLAGAEIVVERWRGFAAQREFALRLAILKHDWVYFVDADEWVSRQLAEEISGLVRTGEFNAYAQRLRLIFMGRWIRHCGWYGGSWVVRLMRASRTGFGDEEAGERARVSSVGRLENDIVDEDMKGLAAWLHKHVAYAQIEARQAGAGEPIVARFRRLRENLSVDTRPLPRAVAKDLILPLVPARPLAFFLYMYIIRLGVLDGKAGFAFCFYHAWYRYTIELLKDRSVSNAKEPIGSGSKALSNASPSSS